MAAAAWWGLDLPLHSSATSAENCWQGFSGRAELSGRSGRASDLPTAPALAWRELGTLTPGMKKFLGGK